MKKFFKFFIAITAIVAGVVGGLIVYSKIKEKECALDDDFDEDEDEDERSYVDIPSDDVKADEE